MATPTQEGTKAKVQNLEGSLVVARHSVENASGALKKCFISAESSNVHFLELRQRFINQVIVFKDVHLKLSLAVVNEIADLFTDFKVLKFEEFKRKECLTGILDKLDRYGRHSGISAQLHKAYQVDITSTEADAKRTAQVLELDANLYAQEAARAAKKAEDAENMAVAACCCGLACLICGPAGAAGVAMAGAATVGAGLAADKSKRNAAKSRSAQEEQHIAEIAGKLILEQLLPPVQCFMEAVSAYHAFFNFLEGRLKRHYVSLADRATLALEFHTLQAGAADLLKECSMFVYAANQARAELQGVQDEASSLSLVDGSTVQRWLENRQQDLNIQPMYMDELLSLGHVTGVDAALPATVPPGQPQ